MEVSTKPRYTSNTFQRPLFYGRKSKQQQLRLPFPSLPTTELSSSRNVLTLLNARPMMDLLKNDAPTRPAPPADALAGPDGIGHGRAQAHDRNAGADILAKPNGFLPENMRDQTEIVAIDDGPPRVSTPTESWVEIHPLCPKCVNEPISRHEKKWKCKWCDETDTNGKWCVEFYPTSLTLNKRQKPRLNQLTLETWKDEDEAKRRAGDLLIHFRGIQQFPQQRTSQTVPQCRAAEALYRVLKQRSIPDDAALKAVGQFFQSSSIEELRFASHLLVAIRDSGLKPPEDLITFLAAYKECGIPCSLLGMMGYCKSRSEEHTSELQ